MGKLTESIAELCTALDKARRFISLIEMDADPDTKEAASAQLVQIDAVLAKVAK